MKEWEQIEVKRKSLSEKTRQRSYLTDQRRKEVTRWLKRAADINQRTNTSQTWFRMEHWTTHWWITAIMEDIQTSTHQQIICKLLSSKYQIRICTILSQPTSTQMRPLEANKSLIPSNSTGNLKKIKLRIWHRTSSLACSCKIAVSGAVAIFRCLTKLMEGTSFLRMLNHLEIA